MDTVPQIISTKDLAYISDMFDWNYQAYKQINHYIDEVQQEEIKELLESASNMHYQHMMLLVAILNGDEFEDDCECCHSLDDSSVEEDDEYDEYDEEDTEDDDEYEEEGDFADEE